ncbi:hypothetical protein Syun_000440 [Stephania yunnanensis]|uniref:Uncharacterized protein n=1 Tax=Stephania yunnanensis TaxID=152371 RepID=A0AAP0LES5_9MAGN
MEQGRLDHERIKRVDDEVILEDDQEKWVYDSSIDHEGRIPRRSTTGAWRASLFVLAIEFSERLSYFGIATNLIIYLTKVLHQDLKTAAKSTNNWAGVTTVMPLVGGFLADAYFGRFAAILIASVVYLMGMSLMTMSQLIPSLKPCAVGTTCDEPRKLHEIIFFLSIYLISVGTGGHKPSLESFGADQFDDDHPRERKQKMSYFNWWNFGLCAGLLIGVTLIVYIQDQVSWAAADVILTSVMVMSVVIFLVGRPYYRYRVAKGSPLTPMLQVLVAAIRNRNLGLPSDPSLLYEVPKPHKAQGRLLCHTDGLRFLDKAAIVTETAGPSTEKANPWRLTTVTRVEELKLLLNVLPIWLSTLTFGLCVAQTSTFFIKQGSTMNRKLTPNFEIPPASIYSLAAISMILTVTIYDRILIPVLRRLTGNERGLNILQRIGTGLLFSILAMVVAALVEAKRLRVVAKTEVALDDKGHVKLGGTLPMSVFWLAPQFVILAIGDGFTLVGLQEYFYDQVPDSMRSLGIAFYLSVIGASSFVSSLLITVVDHLSRRGGGESWFGKDLNHSRLDKFYWLLGAMDGVNFFVYLLLARRYSYKRVQSKVVVADYSSGHEAELRGLGQINVAHQSV